MTAEPPFGFRPLVAGLGSGVRGHNGTLVVAEEIVDMRDEPGPGLTGPTAYTVAKYMH
jgi:hypothetical protein